MDAFDCVRSLSSIVKLSGVVNKLENRVSDIVVIGKTFAVSVDESFVNKLLACLLEMSPIGDKQYVEDHISAKGKRSWRGFERSMRRCSSSEETIGESCVDHLTGILNTFRGIHCRHSTELIAHGLMHAFANEVCLEIFR